MHGADCEALRTGPGIRYTVNVSSGDCFSLRYIDLLTSTEATSLPKLPGSRSGKTRGM